MISTIAANVKPRMSQAFLEGFTYDISLILTTLPALDALTS